MAAVIDLCAPDTVTRQTINSRTSIILNSLPFSSPLSLPTDSNIYSQVFIHKPAFMCKRNTTQAGILGKISSLYEKVRGSDSFITEQFIPVCTPSPPPVLRLSLSSVFNSVHSCLSPSLSFTPTGPSGEPQGSGLRNQQTSTPTDSWL